MGQAPRDPALGGKRGLKAGEELKREKKKEAALNSCEEDFAVCFY